MTEMEAGDSRERQEKLITLRREVLFATRELEALNERLSRLEEQIAALTAPDSDEGRVARCRAIRAAVAAGDLSRAQRLLFRFLAEGGTDESFRESLKAILPSS